MDEGVGGREDEFGFGHVDLEGLGDIPMIYPLEFEAQEKALAQSHKLGLIAIKVKS